MPLETLSRPSALPNVSAFLTILADFMVAFSAAVSEVSEVAFCKSAGSGTIIMAKVGRSQIEEDLDVGGCVSRTKKSKTERRCIIAVVST